MSLRPYQQEAVNSLRRSLGRGKRHPLLVSPTGSGKTHCAVSIIQGAIEKGKDVLFLAPRRELILQASDRLASYGIDHGIIMAGEPRNVYARTQVASMDTLHARGVRTERMLMPKADVVIVDEAHQGLAPTRKKLLESYPEAVIIGLTATPARGDGKGLGEIYDDLVESSSVRELMDDGYLVPARYYAPSKPDLEGLKLNKDGDYVVKVLGERVDKAQLIGDVVDNWFRLARNRQTVVFCVNRAHARHVCEAFKAKGVPASYLDGDTPLDERKQILTDIASGRIQVLVNIFVATYGWDCPAISCVVLARPTRNIALYLQTAGRGLRPHPESGKTDCIIIDHAGAVDEHGFVDDPIPWSLDSATSVRERKQQAQKERGEPKEITCGDCGTVFRSSRTCPTCGHEMIPAGKPIPTHQADLREVQRGKTKDNRNAIWTEKIEFIGQLNSYCRTKGMKPGWVAHKYRDRFGVWPNDQRLKDAPTIPVTPEVAKWITSRNISYAKWRAA